VGIVAVQPLLVRHLLREFSQHFAGFIQRLRVQRVTGRTHGRFANVLRLHGAKPAGGSLHDVRQPVFHDKRTVFGMFVPGDGRLDDEPTVEAGTLPQVAGSDLVTNRASDAVLGGRVLLRIRVEGNVREYLPKLPLLFFLVPRSRHVTVGTTVFNLRLLSGMVHVFAPNAGLPVRIAGRISHDAVAPVESNRNILAGRGCELVVTGETAVRGVERRLEFLTFVGTH